MHLQQRQCDNLKSCTYYQSRGILIPLPLNLTECLQYS
jgi:hypothetical protein